jgi:hypothetical protein
MDQTPLDGLEQILVILLFKVLITCSEREIVPLTGIGRFCGVGKGLTEFKLSCVLPLMRVF